MGRCSWWLDRGRWRYPVVKRDQRAVVDGQDLETGAVTAHVDVALAATATGSPVDDDPLRGDRRRLVGGGPLRLLRVPEHATRAPTTMASAATGIPPERRHRPSCDRGEGDRGKVP